MKYSKHGSCLLPLPGYEQIFEDLNEECKQLRAMIVENVTREQNAGVQLADWQKEIMNGGEPAHNMVWNPEAQAWEPMMTPDEMVLRRRYRKTGGFKPGPVVYPGGEDDGTL